jgi:hypothetical protein
VVDVDRIRNLPQLKLAFASWAGSKWLNTTDQNSALRVEARRIGIPVEAKPFVSLIGGKGLSRFSRSFKSFSSWEQKSDRTSAYQSRIARYMKAHPSATLSEARGHRKM